MLRTSITKKTILDLPELRKHLQLALGRACQVGVQDQECIHPQPPLVLK